MMILIQFLITSAEPAMLMARTSPHARQAIAAQERCAATAFLSRPAWSGHFLCFAL